MNLGQICDAVAERLLDVDGVRPFGFPLDAPPAGQGDVVMVTPAAEYVSFQQAYAQGLAHVGLTLVVWLQMTSERAAFARLNELVSGGTTESRSIVDALMVGDRTFGGVCGDIVVDDVSGVRAEITDGGRWLTCEIGVRVLVGRT